VSCTNGIAAIRTPFVQGACTNDNGALKEKGIRAFGPNSLFPSRAPFGHSSGRPPASTTMKGNTCQVCGAPIARHPCRRAGDRLRFCSTRCARIGRRLVPEDEIVRVITARRIGLGWSVIARELHVSVASVQRGLRRAGVQIRLPRWIVREAATVAKEMSPRVTLNSQRHT
jgi:hypothetical protein